MFNRREKLRIGQRLRGIFWPYMGWRRTGHYFKHRICRIPGTPYEIAGGFACGAAISFSPFVGLHFIMGGILAWLTRTNIFSSIIGTAVGNPWTFPFIWAWIYQCGLWMGASSSNTSEYFSKSSFEELFYDISRALVSGDLNFILVTAGPIFWPMVLGSLPTIAIVWIIFYFSVRALVESYKTNRREIRARKVGKLSKPLKAFNKETK